MSSTTIEDFESALDILITRAMLSPLEGIEKVVEAKKLILEEIGNLLRARAEMKVVSAEPEPRVRRSGPEVKIVRHEAQDITVFMMGNVQMSFSSQELRMMGDRAIKLIEEQLFRKMKEGQPSPVSLEGAGKHWYDEYGPSDNRWDIKKYLT